MNFTRNHLVPRSARVLLICASAVLLLFQGCSTYHSITGYFNTYYNASRLFRDAEAEIQKSSQSMLDTNYFAGYNTSKTAQDKFDKVIEKCSKLIQFYPDSRWIDDAILMIGKSYVYSGEYESGLRKFAELTTNFPTSGLRFEARLWAAKAEYFSAKSDEALQLAKVLITDAHADGQDDIEQEASLLEAQISFDHADYQQAAALYDRTASMSGSDQITTVALLQLGTCNERLSQYEKSASALDKVRHSTNDYSIEFKARLQQGKMLAKAGLFRNALDELEDLKKDPLKPEQRGLVQVEIANTYNAVGDTAKSFAMYDEIDTVYAHTDASAKSYYQRALVCEFQRNDLQSALQYYDKASREASSSEITPLAVRKTAILTNYFQQIQNYQLYDSVIWALTDTTDTTSDSLSDSTALLSHDTLSVAMKADSLRLTPADSLTAVLKSDTASALLAQKKETPEKNFVPPPPKEDLSAPPKDGSGLPPVSEMTPHGDDRIGRPPDNGLNPALPNGQMPGRPGDRRREGDGAPQQLAGNGLPAPGDSTNRALDSLRRAAGSVVRAPVAQLGVDSLKKLLARTELSLGGLFLLDMNIPDSALTWYQTLLEDFPESPLVPQALYSMAAIYQAGEDTVTVDSLYDRIVEEYPRSEYALQIKKARGLDTASALEDSLATRYAAAINLLNDKKPEDAIRLLKEFISGDTTATLVPKAMYTIGWIYENSIVNNDSAAAWYKRLSARYPSSMFAADVKARVAVKDDPKSLPQYVRIKQIQMLSTDVAKEGSPSKSKEKLGKNPPADDNTDENLDDQNTNQDDNSDQETSPDDSDDSTDDPNNN
jgi:cellulose synthase operon protein C